jgi:hypothetical protein
MHRSKVLVAALAVFLLSTSASAATFSWSFIMDGVQEGVVTPGTGNAVVILDDVALTLDVSLSYSGLLGPVNNAHIHCCSLPPVPSGVIIPFVPPMTTGATAGSFANVFVINATLANQIKSGLSYINIHTTVFPGGEIRGQIIPEPGTLSLMSLGLVGLATVRRSLRR